MVWHREVIKMSKALKCLAVIVGSIAINIIASLLWESSLFSAWHTTKDNPATRILNWLSAQTEVHRVVFLSLAAWSLASFVYIWIDVRRIKIHAASYDSHNIPKDVTELVRKKVEQHGLRTIPATNDFLGGDPEFGQPKTLTVDYSVWGRRKRKTAAETELLSLN